MSIKIRFTAQLKDKAGTRVDTVSYVENETLQGFLKRISTQYGIEVQSILFDENGEYRHSNLIVINQSQVNYEDSITLADGVEVTLMSPISGG